MRYQFSVAQAVAMYERGLAINTIATRLRVPFGSLHYRLVREGVHVPRRGKRAVLTWDLARARELRLAGWSFRRIGRELGVAGGTVCAAFGRRGLPTARRRGGIVRFGGIPYYQCNRRLQHRVVAERMIGRRLRPGEVVHHRDGDGLNNDPSNLAVMTRAQHAALHHPGPSWDMATAERLRREGQSFGAIARALGVRAGATVREAFVRRGRPASFIRRAPVPCDVAEATRLYRQRIPLRQIARLLGVNRETLRGILVRHGVHHPASATHAPRAATVSGHSGG